MPSPEVITMGRVGVDLYPEQIGVTLAEVRTFAKSLGGSPTNVAVAAARLGRRAAVITKVGDDGFGVYVRRALAARVRDGALFYNDAVRAGLFRPLGEGAARIKDVLAHLREAGYAGWYVLEQDVMLDADPAPGPPLWIAQSAAFARKNA